MHMPSFLSYRNKANETRPSRVIIDTSKSFRFTFLVNLTAFTLLNVIIDFEINFVFA